MQASDIMSSPVTSVGPHTPILQVAALLRDKRIGGLPVLLKDEIVGIVTEKDLLYRQELGTARRSHTWWRRIVERRLEPEWYVKSHGRRARHVMTREVVVAKPETSLQEITVLFDRNRIGRLPVVRGGKLVGIVACADLVRVLSQGSWIQARKEEATNDQTISSTLTSELRAQGWWDASMSTLDVTGGIVRFSGYFETEWQRRAACVAAENTAGVQHVIDERHPMAELPTMF